MTNFELAHDIALELASYNYIDDSDKCIADVANVIEKELDSHNIKTDDYDEKWE